MTDQTNATDQRPKSVWPFVLLANLISVVWAVIYIVSNVGELPRPDGTPFGDGQAIGELFGSAVAPAFVTWLLFHFLVFRRRANFAKSASVLAIMAVVNAVVVAAPVSVILNSARHSEAVRRQLEEATEANLGALGQRLRADIAALRLPLNPLADIHTAADVEVSLNRIQRARALFQNYTTAVNTEIAAARQRIAAAELAPAQRQQELQALDREMGELSLAQRSITLASAAMDNVGALLVFLQNNSEHWTERDGRFIFDDANALDQFNTLTAAHDQIAQQLSSLQEELAAARDGPAGNAETPKPVGSAPLPRR